jgi:hypothetical protein
MVGSIQVKAVLSKRTKCGTIHVANEDLISEMFFGDIKGRGRTKSV